MRASWVVIAATAMAIYSATAVAEEKQKCSERELVKAGTFEATVTSVGLIVGARWGSGILTLNNGDTHRFSLKGAKVMEIGAAKKQLAGTIYNLEKLDDFPGTYLGVGGGLTAVTAGLGGVSITNGACVVLNASAKDSKGLQVSMPIAPGGVLVALEK
jgi:hypothetical protein